MAKLGFELATTGSAIRHATNNCSIRLVEISNFVTKIVHGQVNGQNPLREALFVLRFYSPVNPMGSCRMRGTSNEYPEHMFSSRLIILVLFLDRAVKSLSQNEEIEISYLSSGKWDKLDKSGMVFPQPWQYGAKNKRNGAGAQHFLHLCPVKTQISSTGHPGGSQGPKVSSDGQQTLVRLLKVFIGCTCNLEVHAVPRLDWLQSPVIKYCFLIISYK